MGSPGYYTHKHEKMGQIEDKRDYLKATTEANHYDWPIRNKFKIFLKKKLGLVDPKPY
jgi:hypothetical protein